MAIICSIAASTHLGRLSNRFWKLAAGTDSAKGALVRSAAESQLEFQVIPNVLYGVEISALYRPATETHFFMVQA